MSQSRLRAAFAAVALTAAVAQAAPAAADSTATGTRHVIVRSADGNTAAVRALVRHVGGHVDRTLGLIHAVAATVPAAALPTLRADREVAEVTADARVHLAGARNFG